MTYQIKGISNNVTEIWKKTYFKGITEPSICKYDTLSIKKEMRLLYPGIPGNTLGKYDYSVTMFQSIR